MTAGIILAFLCLGAAGAAQQKPRQEKNPHLVEIATVQRSSLGVNITRTGTLRALREVKIFTQEEGRITALPFYEGDQVKAGELVARLDHQLLQAQLARARATRHKAERDLQRARALYQKKLIPDEELSRIETDFEIARADEQVLDTRLGYTTIRAPFSGIVSARLTEPGNIAARYEHLLTLSDPASLITEVTLSELLISKLAVGDSVQVRIDALGPRSSPGRVSRIHPNLDPVTRRGTVEVELKPVPEGARPGQLCRVALRTQAAERLIIPFRALRRDQAGEFVYLLDETSRVKRRAVVSGLRIGVWSELLQGPDEGARIVTKGFLGLGENMLVKVVGAPAAATRP